MFDTVRVAREFYGTVRVHLNMTGWAGVSIRPLNAEVRMWGYDELIAANRRMMEHR